MDILAEYRKQKEDIISAKKKKSFAEAADNLFIGAKVKISSLKPGVSIITGEVKEIKDTLFSVGDFRFYKLVDKVLEDNSTEHLCYGKQNKDIVATIGPVYEDIS